MDASTNTTGTEEERLACGCWNCFEGLKDKHTGWPITLVRFIVCPHCGNKRCPRASDHTLECTGSNEPGQKGSRWEGSKWE